MRLSRREFLTAIGLAGGAVATGGLIRALGASSRVDLKSLAAVALDRARALGCSYADVRLDRCEHADGVRERCAVRVIDAGAWGVAVSDTFGEAEVESTVARALASARMHAAAGTDPFSFDRRVIEPVRPREVRFEEMYFTSFKGGSSGVIRRFS